MTLNSNVNVDTESSAFVDTFYPDEGYALWQDDEYDNLDENGQPHQYYLQKNIRKVASEAASPHIWAKLIDDTMEVYSKANQPAVMSLGLDDEGAANASHTYIDENSIEREKKGVY